MCPVTACSVNTMLLNYVIHTRTLCWQPSSAGFNNPRWKVSWTFQIKSDVNLFNHLVWKSDVAGCCSAGSVLWWHNVSPYSVLLICIIWSCFYVNLMQINQYDTCVIIDYFSWFDGVHTCCDKPYIDDNHYHFVGPFRRSGPLRGGDLADFHYLWKFSGLRCFRSSSS